MLSSPTFLCSIHQHRSGFSAVSDVGVGCLPCLGREGPRAETIVGPNDDQVALASLFMACELETPSHADELLQSWSG